MGSRTRVFSHLRIKPGTKVTLMFPDVYENRQRQGIRGEGDEDQILGDPTVPIMCSKYQGIGTALR